MNSSKINVILSYVFAVVVLGGLGAGGWLLWEMKKQTALQEVWLRAQTGEQQAEVKKLNTGLEKISAQVAEVVQSGERQNAELKTELTAIDKNNQDRSSEHLKAQEQLSSVAMVVEKDVKQNLSVLEQLDQALTAQKDYLSDTRVDLGVRIAEVENWVENIAKIQAYQHHQRGLRKWDEGDVRGAIAEFNQSVLLNKDSSGDYYNMALGYYRLGHTNQACAYAYQAGSAYFRNKDQIQAQRMVELLKVMDANSDYIAKLTEELSPPREPQQ